MTSSIGRIQELVRDAESQAAWTYRVRICMFSKILKMLCLNMEV